MSPLKEINTTQASFLRELFTKIGLPIDGQAFQVAFGDEGAERTIVVGEQTVASDADVLAAVSGLLSGVEVFRPISAIPTAVHPEINSVKLDPSTILRDLFQNEGERIPNALHRGGIITVGDVLELLQSQDGEERLGAFTHVGPKTIAEVKRKLGLK